jgi:hypothetical protein
MLGAEPDALVYEQLVCGVVKRAQFLARRLNALPSGVDRPELVEPRIAELG